MFQISTGYGGSRADEQQGRDMVVVRSRQGHWSGPGRVIGQVQAWSLVIGQVLVRSRNGEVQAWSGPRQCQVQAG